MIVAQSYFRGVAPSKLIELTIGEIFRSVVEANPEREAIVSRHQNLRYDFATFAAEVDRAARALIALGVESGDRVAILSTNSAGWLVSQYGGARGGALVALAPAGVGVIVAGAGFRGFDYLSFLRGLIPELASGTFASQRFPSLRALVHLGPPGPDAGLSWEEFLALGQDVSEGALAERQSGLRPEDPSNIIYTSGTTGTPKGATLSHRTVVNCGYFVGERLRFRPHDRLCLPVPLYHVFGCILGNLAAMTHGSALVLPGAEFDAGASLAAVEVERCTALYGVPTMFLAEIEHPERPHRRLDSLRTGIVAGAPCTGAFMTKVIEELHLPEITISYGLTESPPASQTFADDPLERRVETVGTPLPHVECRIVEAQGTETVPLGEAGELCTRGFGVMLGYWGEREATAAAIDADGWLHTGDLAVMEAGGYLRIVGRLKDMIIRAGENVYPREMETFLQTHPKIAEAHVFGVPDPDHGEEACAWIRLREGEYLTSTEIRRFSRDKIPAYKGPRHIRFVREFPTTVTGKVQKFRMREIVLAEAASNGLAGNENSLRRGE